jgi:hypothetical protein
MRSKKPEAEEPASVASNFPPPPPGKTSARRKAQPPVVTSGTGNLACKSLDEGGRVRMVCE